MKHLTILQSNENRLHQIPDAVSRHTGPASVFGFIPAACRADQRPPTHGPVFAAPHHGVRCPMYVHAPSGHTAQAFLRGPIPAPSRQEVQL